MRAAASSLNVFESAIAAYSKFRHYFKKLSLIKLASGFRISVGYGIFIYLRAYSILHYYTGIRSELNCGESILRYLLNRSF